MVHVTAGLIPLASNFLVPNGTFFVELIAFPQTREYVKRVTSIYAKYRHLYGATPYEIPLTLTTKVDSRGPTY